MYDNLITPAIPLLPKLPLILYSIFTLRFRLVVQVEELGRFYDPPRKIVHI